MESYSSSTAAANILSFIEHKNKEPSNSSVGNKRGKHGGKKGNGPLATIEANSPIENINLIDIKIQPNVDEDKLFEKDDDVFTYIHRGNCVIKHFNKVYIGRIGLPKFFDYKKEYNAQEKTLELRVLGPVKESKKKLKLYYTEKANGENCQISYNKQTGMFLVGSKNVTIGVRDRKDIEWYKNKKIERFSYAIDFAISFFDIIEKRIGDKIEAFKEELAGYTIVGESVGDPNHQHIKIYKERDIFFYGMIDNEKYAKGVCVSLPKSFGFFKKYGLSTVPVQQSEIFNNYEEMIAGINKKYDEVLVKNVEEGGEGDVVYFSEVDDDGNERVLSMAKLKTFEYRFYRKLREKSRHIRSKKHKMDAQEGFSRTKKECLELLEGQESKVDFEKYMKFAEYFCFYTARDEMDYSNVFAMFIKYLEDCFNKGIKVEDINVSEVNQKFKDIIEKGKTNENEDS